MPADPANPPVPFMDLPGQTRGLAAELREAMDRVLAHSQFILGPEVTAFEQAWARYCGAAEAVGVGSGTDAIHLILRGLGIGPGDEVITVANTFIATVEAITYAGARPVLVDCRADDFLIDPDAVAAAITPRTRAILPVHLYGQPANWPALEAVAARHGLALIEDAAQAHGARLADGRRCGSLGRAAAFSFYPGKNLGAFGDAGAVTTGDRALAGQVRLLRNWGSTVRYHHEVAGFNSRLDTLQAAVLGVKLGRLEGWLTRRQEIAQWYRDLLANDARIQLPREAPWCGRHAYHLFVVRVPAAARDAAIAALGRGGIQALVHYPIPVHLQKAYASLGQARGAFPQAEAAAASILSLPLFPEMTRAQCERVAAALRAALG